MAPHTPLGQVPVNDSEADGYQQIATEVAIDRGLGAVVAWQRQSGANPGSRTSKTGQALALGQASLPPPPGSSFVAWPSANPTLDFNRVTLALGSSRMIGIHPSEMHGLNIKAGPDPS